MKLHNLALSSFSVKLIAGQLSSNNQNQNQLNFVDPADRYDELPVFQPQNQATKGKWSGGGKGGGGNWAAKKARAAGRIQARKANKKRGKNQGNNGMSEVERELAKLKELQNQHYAAMNGTAFRKF